MCCGWTGEHEALGDRFIHDRDLDWLRQSDGEVSVAACPSFLTSPVHWAGVTSDLWTYVCVCSVVVAEVTQPSLGVGYELGRAVDMKKKVFCLFRPSGRRELTSGLGKIKDTNMKASGSFPGACRAVGDDSGSRGRRLVCGSRLR